MSRADYCEDLDNWALIKWRGQVASAIRGRRGQAFLTDLLKALDALPRPRLIAGHLERDGEVCALGSICRERNVTLPDEDSSDVNLFLAEKLDIAEQLVREIEFLNDDCVNWSPEGRFTAMRRWVASNIRHEQN